MSPNSAHDNGVSPGPNAGAFQRAYAVVARIPIGRVTTYGAIAAAIGNPRLARRVGQAMYAAPQDRHLPCHRVLKKDGSLTLHEQWREMQRELLHLEGVPFLPDGRVDMTACGLTASDLLALGPCEGCGAENGASRHKGKNNTHPR